MNLKKIINIILALLFLVLGFKNLLNPYNYLIMIFGISLIIYNLKIVFYEEDFLNINILLFGPLLIILCLTKNENLKHLSFIVGISIILFYIKEKYNLELFNKFYLGKGARHNLISPKLATAYLTIKGKSFSRYISMELQRFVHLMK